MRRIFKKNRSLSVLSVLISGIAVLCLGFFITMCGSGPQPSATLINRGAYAIDFSSAPAELGYIDLGRSIQTMASTTQFTIEAWVKRKTAGDLTGGIFSRSTDDGGATGIVLDIPTANSPRFAMAIADTLYFVTPAATGTTIANNQWTHIAGVFTNQSHGTGVHSTCRAGYATTSAYHLDLYMNGTFINCASATATRAFAYSERIGRTHTNVNGIMGLEINTKLDAVIDEVRFWKAARTGSQIQQCMGQEIGVSGACGLSSDLIGYWRFNTGAGSAVSDSSGTGNGGTIYYCSTDCVNGGDTILWAGGWTAGYPF